MCHCVHVSLCTCVIVLCTCVIVYMYHLLYSAVDNTHSPMFTKLQEMNDQLDAIESTAKKLEGDFKDSNQVVCNLMHILIALVNSKENPYLINYYLSRLFMKRKIHFFIWRSTAIYYKGQVSIHITASCTIIVVHSRDSQEVSMAHEVKSPKNQPQFS